MHASNKKWKKPGIFFILSGIIASLWFLIRVIPKPSRATYPCQRIAFPVASSFVIYVLGILGSLTLIKKGTSAIIRRRPFMAAILVLAGLTGTFLLVDLHREARANENITTSIEPNSPSGTPCGIFPGRVSWSWNPSATRENMSNKSGDYWWDDANTHQEVVDSMILQSVCSLTGTNNLRDGMDSLFHFFNRQKNGLNAGYQSGQKLVIKCNFQISSAVDANYYNANSYLSSCTITSPQVIFAILKLLIDDYGVDQEDIYVGDPVKYFTKPYFDKCFPHYPEVHYINAKTESNREKLEYTDTPVFYSSDGSIESILPSVYVDADYIINLAVLKTHQNAGVTSCAKNHFGSLALPSTSSASHLHYSLPAESSGNNEYRVLADIMGHRDLGEKTLLYVIDGLWGGGGSKGKASPPVKWQMEPFNNDYPNSIFMSQDPVAIESVCFDFCLEEFPDLVSGSLLNGLHDLYLQVSDASNWPDGIIYDPENDGTAMRSSLGVYEHWNNPSEKKYSVNLGITGGIELYNANNWQATGMETISLIETEVFPNPFQNSFSVRLAGGEAIREIRILDAKGRLVFHKKPSPDSGNTHYIELPGIQPGIYYLNVVTADAHQTKKIISVH